MSKEQMLTISEEQSLLHQSDDYFIHGTSTKTVDVDKDYVEINKGRVLPIGINPRSNWVDMNSSKRVKVPVTINKRESAKNRIKLDEGARPALETYDRQSSSHGGEVLLDGGDVLSTVGGVSNRQVHYLNLRSAYESSSVCGEPVFTQSLPATGTSCDLKCSDYVFYNEASLELVGVLALPRLCSIHGDNKQLPAMVQDKSKLAPPQIWTHLFGRHSEIDFREPNSKQKLLAELSKSNADIKDFWAGSWMPSMESNQQRTSLYLPTYSSGSSHLPMCCDFRLNASYVATQWHNGFSELSAATEGSNT
jgi:hypothetical protein